MNELDRTIKILRITAFILALLLAGVIGAIIQLKATDAQLDEILVQAKNLQKIASQKHP